MPLLQREISSQSRPSRTFPAAPTVHPASEPRRDVTLHVNVELERARSQLAILDSALREVLQGALRRAMPIPEALLAGLGGVESLRRLHHVGWLVGDSPHEAGRSAPMVANLGRVCGTLEALDRALDDDSRAWILASEKDSLEQLVMDVEEGKVAGRFRPGNNHTLIEQVARDLKRSTSRLKKLDELERALRSLPTSSWLGRGRREHALADLAGEHGPLLTSFGIRKRAQLDDSVELEALLDRVSGAAAELREHVRGVRADIYRDESLLAVELRDSGVDLESVKVVALLKELAGSGLECVLRLYTIYDTALASVRGGGETLARIRALKHDIRDTEARTDTATALAVKSASRPE